MPAKRPAKSTRPESPLHRDARELHAALAHLVRIYQFRDRDKICCHDISVTQSYALEVLAERGPQRSQVLAEALKLDKSTVTRVVDALVRKGYAERSADADDARAVSLRITRSGRSLYERINSDLIEQQAGLLRDLDPELRAGATDLIRRLGQAAEACFLSGPGVGTCAPAGCTPGSSAKVGCG